MTGPQKRETHVETMRGLTCLALVSYHVVGATPQVGLEVPGTDWLFRLQLMLADMRMPLFSFISGYVFTAVLSARKSWGQVLTSKMRRLLVPMIFVGGLFWVIGDATGRVQMPWVDTLFLPYAHFWFLQATFTLMVLLLALNWLYAQIRPDAFARDPKAVSVRNAALIGALGAAIFISGRLDGFQIFSFPRAAYLAPFFMGGHIVAQRLKPALAGLSDRGWPRVLAGLWLGALVLWGALCAFQLLGPWQSEIRRSLSVLVGLTAALSFLVLRVHIRFLAWIGDKSFTIYLFHVFFTAAATLAMQHLLPALDRHWIYPVSLLCGLTGPILLHQVILQSRVSRFLCLGIGMPFAPRRVATAAR
ncbi:acyltransferase (plasmid) [Thioclava litoralis]|uniref:Acyltransferase n=1 Tax=Thioclava litoralis TaxID=3076557 RepID=A0ABZ1E3J5_9RHOB|nr:acyltransferase [Thioclava sp. FTW29]